MTIALAHVGKNGGVTVADVNLKLIWDVISAIHVGEKGYAYVVDDRGRLIADPDLSIVLRDTDLSTLPQVQAALAKLKSREAANGVAPIGGSAEIAKGRDGGDVLTAYAIAPKPRWIVFVQQPLAEAFASVTQSLLRTLALLGLGLLLALVSGVALASRMAAPIRLLKRAPSGSARATIRSASTSAPATRSRRWPAASIRWPGASRRATRPWRPRSRRAPATSTRLCNSRPRRPTC